MLTRDPGRNLLLRAVDCAGRVIARALSPAALAWKVKMQTTPVPFTPVAPGGREASMVMAARPVVAVHQRDGLSIPAQEIAAIHVDQRKLGRVVLNLHGNRCNINPAGQHQRNLEGGPRGHWGTWGSASGSHCRHRVRGRKGEARWLRSASDGGGAQLRQRSRRGGLGALARDRCRRLDRARRNRRGRRGASGPAPRWRSGAAQSAAQGPCRWCADSPGPETASAQCAERRGRRVRRL